MIHTARAFSLEDEIYEKMQYLATVGCVKMISGCKEPKNMRFVRIKGAKHYAQIGKSMQSIYVIEDDENIRNLVKIALGGYGYEVITFESAEPAVENVEKDMPALAIFDLMLPGMSGLDAIKLIRQKEKVSKLPIIILTAKDKEYDKVTGLDGGADDYMTKPFGVLELAARVRSLLRRVEEKPSKRNDLEVSYGDLRINHAAREVYMKGQLLNLTYKEYELLNYLMENQNRVVEREELLNELWDYTVEVETRTLDIHIKTLRKKLGEEGSSYIKTVRSVGYRFVTG